MRDSAIRAAMSSTPGRAAMRGTMRGAGEAGAGFEQGFFQVFGVEGAHPDDGDLVTKALALAEAKLGRKLKRLQFLQGTLMVEEVSVDAGGANLTPALVAARIVAAVKAVWKKEVVPLSFIDRATLGQERQVLAQTYYEISRDLAEEVCGTPDAAKFKNVNFSNLPDVLSLWLNQARYGKGSDTLWSIPVTLLATLLGTIGGTPIEGVSIKGGKVVGSSASGHGMNLLVSGGVAAGFMLLGTPATAALAGLLLGGYSGITNLAKKDLNAPVHELVHSIQFLTLGKALKDEIIDTQDFFEIQNDVNSKGYLWGGETEEATHKVEGSGEIGPIFETMIRLGDAHLKRRYPQENRAARFATCVRGVRDQIETRFKSRLPS